MSIRTASAMAESEASLTSYNTSHHTATSSNIPPSSSNRSKYFTTFATCFTYLSYSLMWFMTVSSQHELSSITSSTVRSVQTSYIIQNVSYVFGAVLFGILYDRCDRQIGLGICLNMTACMTILIPFSSSLTWLMLLQISRGFLMSGIEVACITLILEIYGPQANMILQVQQLMFTIGHMIVPYLVQSFTPITGMTDASNLTVSGKLEFESNLHPVCHEMLTELQEKLRNGNNNSNIVIPYTITTITALASASLVILFKIPKAKYQRISSESNLYIISIDNLTCETTPMNIRNKKTRPVDKKKNWYRIVAVILGFLMISCFCGVRDTESYFLPRLVNDVVVVAVNRQEYLDQSGNLMMDLMQGMSAITNATAILVTMYISAMRMLFFNLILIITSNIMLIIFTKFSLIMTWLSVVMMGIGFGSMFGCMFAFLSEKIVMSNTITGLLLMSTKLPIIINWIAFDPPESCNPMTFIYLNTSSVTISAACFAVLCLNNNWFRARIPRKQEA